MSNILVTGGLGFIGSFLVDALVDLGHIVDVVDDLSTGDLRWIVHHNNVQYFIGDVVSWCSQRKSFRQYDFVFHLANNARIAMSFEFPKETLVNNYASTVAILEYMRKNCPEAILLFASSSTTEFTDRFNNPYTFSKYMCDEVLELYAKHYNLKYNVVKFYNVYGSMREADLGQYTTIIKKFKQKVLANEPLPVYNPERRRDFTSIDDTIVGLIEIIKNPFIPSMTYHLSLIHI